MGDWKNEDDLNADLRSLTGDLKRLREELRSPAKPNRTRALLHREPPLPAATPAIVPVANEAPHPRKKPSTKRTR